LSRQTITAEFLWILVPTAEERVGQLEKRLLHWIDDKCWVWFRARCATYGWEESAAWDIFESEKRKLVYTAERQRKEEAEAKVRAERQRILKDELLYRRKNKRERWRAGYAKRRFPCPRDEIQIVEPFEIRDFFVTELSPCFVARLVRLASQTS
jgi:hypothetical protein